MLPKSVVHEVQYEVQYEVQKYEVRAVPQTNSVLLAWFGAICRPYILEGSSIYIYINQIC